MSYPPLSNSIVNALRRRYLAGQSVGRLAYEYGLTFNTVMKYVRDLHVPIVRISDKRVIQFYRLTGRLAATASMASLSKTTVWRRLKKYGVVVGKGTRDSKRLYTTLRARIVRSEWRQSILRRDRSKCVECGTASNTVHHTRRLATIRDIVALETNVDPFASFADLRRFTDAVMAAHVPSDGIVLCKHCHAAKHRSPTRRR
jgi:5-methylcytosine-specific restriction endonuclease McrA